MSPWPSTAQPAREDHLELLLDRALEATFPASDPVALTLARDFLPARHAGGGRLATGPGAKLRQPRPPMGG